MIRPSRRDDYEHDHRIRADDKRAVRRAAVKIERAIRELVDARLSWWWGGTLDDNTVADEIFEQLLIALIDRNPKAMDWLNRHRGEATMRLAVTLMDWRDNWAER
jgi:hypothetical protein